MFILIEYIAIIIWLKHFHFFYHKVAKCFELEGFHRQECICPRCRGKNTTGKARACGNKQSEKPFSQEKNLIYVLLLASLLSSPTSHLVIQAKESEGYQGLMPSAQLMLQERP